MTTHPEVVGLVSFVEAAEAARAVGSHSSPSPREEAEAKRLCCAVLGADTTADEAHTDFLMLSSMQFVSHRGQKQETWSGVANRLAGLAKELGLA